MTSATILLIEDNLDDEPMTRHLLKRHSQENRIDEAEALDYLHSMPAVDYCVVRDLIAAELTACPTSTVVE
jgi:hypothetical protein